MIEKPNLIIRFLIKIKFSEENYLRDDMCDNAKSKIYAEIRLSDYFGTDKDCGAH